MIKPQGAETIHELSLLAYSLDNEKSHCILSLKGGIKGK